jgi:hypothetical protein
LTTSITNDIELKVSVTGQNLDGSKYGALVGANGVGKIIDTGFDDQLDFCLPVEPERADRMRIMVTPQQNVLLRVYMSAHFLDREARVSFAVSRVIKHPHGVVTSFFLKGSKQRRR